MALLDVAEVVVENWSWAAASEDHLSWVKQLLHILLSCDLGHTYISEWGLSISHLQLGLPEILGYIQLLDRDFDRDGIL